MVTKSRSSRSSDLVLMLSPAEVAAILGIAPRSLRRLIARKQFPAPRRLSRRLVRWHHDTVRAFIEDTK